MNQHVDRQSFVQPPQGKTLPQALLPAWNQWERMQETGDKSWIHDQRPQDDTPRAQQILLYAAKAYGDSRRKFGPGIRREIHEIRGMHKIYNFSGLEKWKIDRFLAVFSYGGHDIVETLRENAEKEKRPFTAKGAAIARAEMGRILDEPRLFVPMYKCQVYITDDLVYTTDDPVLRHKQRMDAQIAKSFDSAGVCIISPLEQLERGIDKWEQVTFDKWARENGYLPDEMLTTQIERAKEKAYTLEFPIIKSNPEIVAEYLSAQAYLEDDLRLVSTKHYIPGFAAQAALSPAP